MERLLLALMVLAGGMMLPVQAGMNARLGKGLSSPIWAAAVSFLVGAVGLVLYSFASRQQPEWGGIKSLPAWVWIGGLLGAFYVTVSLIALPRLGAAFTFGLIVAGQLTISLLLDHFGILVHEVHPINWWRLLGVALIIGGVLLIRSN